MNEALFNLGFGGVGWTSSKNLLISRGKKTKKTKQINKIIEKEREIQKLIYSIKPKLHDIAIYNKKPNYLIEHRYYIEVASQNLSCRTTFLKADNVLRDLKVSEILFQVIAAKCFTEFLP